MKKGVLRFFVVSLLLFAVVGLSACSSPSLPTLPSLGRSSVTVMGAIDDLSLMPTESGEIVDAQIVLTRGKHSVERRVPVQQYQFEAEIQLALGKWELYVLLLDGEGRVQFQSATQEIEVTPGKPIVIDLVLRPSDSEVTVSIDLTGYILRDLALRARVHFDDDIYEIVREDVTEPLRKVLSIPPGSYEFKIELYTESFRVGDRLGPGVWEIIDIPPNETIEIVWSPLAIGLEVRGRVESLLPAPENMRVSDADGTLIVTWDPVLDERTMGYFLFAQTNPLERFELLTPIPLEHTSYHYELDGDTPPNDVLFTVATVSQSGFVGYYSPTYHWSKEAQD